MTTLKLDHTVSERPMIASLINRMTSDCLPHQVSGHATGNVLDGSMFGRWEKPLRFRVAGNTYAPGVVSEDVDEAEEEATALVLAIAQSEAQAQQAAAQQAAAQQVVGQQVAAQQAAAQQATALQQAVQQQGALIFATELKVASAKLSHNKRSVRLEATGRALLGAISPMVELVVQQCTDPSRCFIGAALPRKDALSRSLGVDASDGL
jgi:hypothetical protein